MKSESKINEAEARQKIRTENTLQIRDAWYTLIFGINPETELGRSESKIKKILLPSEYQDMQESAELSLEFFPFTEKHNLSTPLAVLKIQALRKDAQSRLSLFEMCRFEITGGVDERGRVALTSDLRVKPEFEGIGLGSGMVGCLTEFFFLVAQRNLDNWEGKPIYAIATDLAKNAASQAINTRKNWSSSRVRELGYTRDEEYIASHLGKDLLPLAENTFIKIITPLD